MPRNKTLMRIFKDLGMVEYLGSGMPRILKAYPRKDEFRDATGGSTGLQTGLVKVDSAL